MKKLVFFYPTIEINGVANQFILLAKYFKKLKYKIAIIDSKKGYIKRKLIDEAASGEYEFLEYDYPNKIVLNEESIIITPASFINRINREIVSEIPNKIKIIFWSLHPHNLVWDYKNWNYIKNLDTVNMSNVISSLFPETYVNYKKMIEYISNKNSLYFMDQSNFDFPKEVYDLNLKCEKFLPIAIENQEDKVVRKCYPKNYCWIGRIVDDKVFSLIKILHDTNKYAIENNTSINFYIVGSGDYEYLLEKEIANNEWNINIIFIGKLSLVDLIQFLKEKIDLVIAMGSSCLEAGILGIPVILVNASNSAVTKMEYKWLYNTKNYSLGSFVELQNENIISNLKDLNIEDFKYHGLKTMEYVEGNHSVFGVSQALNLIFEQDLITLEEVKNHCDQFPIKFNNKLVNLIIKGYYSNPENVLNLSNILSDIEKEYLNKGYNNILIWGTSNHTKALLKNYKFMKMNFMGFIDSKLERSEFLGYPKYTIHDLPKLNVDIILISTLTYEDQIYDDYHKFVEDQGIKLYPLYKENEGEIGKAIWNQISSEIMLDE